MPPSKENATFYFALFLSRDCFITQWQTSLPCTLAKKQINEQGFLIGDLGPFSAEIYGVLKLFCLVHN